MPQFPLPETVQQILHKGATPVVPIAADSTGAYVPAGGVTQIVGGTGDAITVGVIRPSNTTSYTAGDAVGATSAIWEFPLIGTAGSQIVITDSILHFDLSAVPAGMTSFTLHLFSSSPTAIADNAAWTLATAQALIYLGSINLGTPVDLGSVLLVEQTSLNKVVKLASTSLFGLVVTAGAYAGASATPIQITLNAVEV